MGMRNRGLRGLLGAGAAFAVLGMLQVLVSDDDASGYGIATGGTLVLCAGLIAGLRSRRS
ncbi:hypothetical protein [Candidatus Blastococcus massiliensis]|uniref:hypothetical protein n=1 Tax=Candidatus Blastococcus massiliensis TaxID=1470358 RepID=UPI0012DC8E35|nr:hypothetical protein [Candidatus Blastococcus massiliensis]